MNRRNAAREYRRAASRRNHLANTVCTLLAAGRPADPKLLAEWEVADAAARRAVLNFRPNPETQNPNPNQP